MGAMTSLAKALLPALLVALAAAACLPKPDDPVEWLHREDSVIVQKQSVFSDKFPYDWYGEVDSACGVPEFTLYGDGTLIFRELEPAGLDYGRLISREQLDDDDVANLLEAIQDEGFLNFTYEQLRPEPTGQIVRSTSATTFIYANTKFAANAVSAYALNTVGAPQDGGKEWGQYRRVQEIAERIDEVALRVSVGDFLSFEPEGLLLVVRPIEGEPPDDPHPWLGTVSLAELAPEGSDIVTRRVADRDELASMSGIESLDELGTIGGLFFQDDRVFYLCTRPVLPFEEHFPEFEPPQ